MAEHLLAILQICCIWQKKINVFPSIPFCIAGVPCPKEIGTVETNSQTQGRVVSHFSEVYKL